MIVMFILKNINVTNFCIELNLFIYLFVMLLNWMWNQEHSWTYDRIHIYMFWFIDILPHMTYMWYMYFVIEIIISLGMVI